MASIIGGSFGRGSSSSTSTTTGSESGQSTVTRLDQEQLDLVQQLTSLLVGNVREGSPQFSPQQARQDVQGSIENLYRTYSEEVLPQIFSAQAGAGAYNTATAQLMANDAFARTTAEAGALELQAITNYAQLGQQQQGITLQGLQALLNAQLEAREQTEYSSEFTSTTRSRGSSSGFNVGGSFRL